MSLTTLSPDTTASLAVPILSPLARASLVLAGPLRYRAVTAGGRILGHVQLLAHPLGTRFRAQRFHPATGRFRDLGDFWSADEAVSCLSAGG